MRPEGNPLDLNNLPDEYSRDGKQVLEDTSSPGCRKKKNGGKEGKDECGKVYECRFCSLKFCKSQALGGHMNRHRQERETETLNHARQLVFRNDHNIVPQPPSHLGCCPPIAPAGYHPAAGNMGAGDPTMPLRFPRYFSSGSSSSTHMMPPPPPPPPPPPQPSQPYLYASQTRPMSFPTHLIPMNEYHVGHVLSNNHNYGGESSNYTCIGAPVGVGGQGFVGSGRGGSSKEGTVQEEGLNWGRSYSAAPSAINRFQDHGF